MKAHSFHIPVMGTGFTVDTPLKVACYGISSVISLVDDKLVENMRRYYCDLYRENYIPIEDREDDCRARRITEYLNLVDRLVQKQVVEVKESPFEPGSEISKYFEWADDASALKRSYREMLEARDPDEKSDRQAGLREKVTAGAIDVNIMTKIDRENFRNGVKLSREFSDAQAALRGFAKSTLHSSVIFSAGLNLSLYGYLGEWNDFYPDPDGEIKKKVTLKVSDFRSAIVQAKVLAKKGIWVSEYRIESGLNCGGHAFPTTGRLMGPILEEFKSRQEPLRTLFEIYREVLLQKKGMRLPEPPSVRVTAQGGVGTAAEHGFLLRYYELDSVGWGSPFLLVPEATAVDGDTLAKLAAAGEGDIYLSDSSPLGVPFYTLKNSASEEIKKQRIASGKPGSPCVNKYLALNTEYERPLCTASFEYQNKKIKDLKEKKLGAKEFAAAYQQIVEKACICRELGDGALAKYGIAGSKRTLSPAVCPGPNLAYFSRLYTLKEMIGHIYGRFHLIDPSVLRPHVFIKELRLYVDYLKEAMGRAISGAAQREREHFAEFTRNLFEGIEYYKKLAGQLHEESEESRKRFLEALSVLREELENIVASHPFAFPELLPIRR